MGEQGQRVDEDGAPRRRAAVLQRRHQGPSELRGRVEQQGKRARAPREVRGGVAVLRAGAGDRRGVSRRMGQQGLRPHEARTVRRGRLLRRPRLASRGGSPGGACVTGTIVVCGTLAGSFIWDLCARSSENWGGATCTGSSTRSPWTA